MGTSRPLWKSTGLGLTWLLAAVAPALSGVNFLIAAGVGQWKVGRQAVDCFCFLVAFRATEETYFQAATIEGTNCYRQSSHQSLPIS